MKSKLDNLKKINTEIADLTMKNVIRNYNTTKDIYDELSQLALIADAMIKQEEHAYSRVVK